MRNHVFAACGLALLLAPAVGEAQTPTRRRTQAIEIRGQVPTPQVVTVRPREVPTFSRQVISPNFFDRDFWPSILPGYQVVSPQMITGVVPIGADSALRGPAAGSPTTPGSATPATTPGTTPQGMTIAPPPTGTPRPNLQTTTGTPTAPAANDTTRSTTGTPPARPRR